MGRTESSRVRQGACGLLVAAGLLIASVGACDDGGTPTTPPTKEASVTPTLPPAPAETQELQAPAGRLVYLYETMDGDRYSSELRLVDPAGGAEQVVDAGLPGLQSLSVMPNTQELLYVGCSGPELGFCRPRVYAFDTARTAEIETVPAAEVVASPDGSRIAYTGGCQSGLGAVVYVADLDGSNERQLFFDDRQNQGACYLSWSPDGASLIFVGSNGVYDDVYSLAADGGEPKRIGSLALDCDPLRETFDACSEPDDSRIRVEGLVQDPVDGIIVLTLFSNDRQHHVRTIGRQERESESGKFERICADHGLCRISYIFPEGDQVIAWREFGQEVLVVDVQVAGSPLFRHEVGAGRNVVSAVWLPAR